MLSFILRRLISIIPTFIGVTIITFVLVRLIPGDPVLLMAGERGLSPERHAELMAELGLDKHILLQYKDYLVNIFQGDLGTSLVTHTSVFQEFMDRFPATVELGFCAIIFATIIGLPLGILAANNRGNIIDHTVMGTALTGYSMPIFWWGVLLIMFFSVTLGWTPVSGRISALIWLEETPTGFMLIDTLLAGEDAEGGFTSALLHLILPAIVLGTIPLAVIARMTRSSMLEVLQEDYIRTARAKGLSPKRVIFIHALRNALIPVITVIGLQVSVLFGGAILTETIFAWPGIGKWLVDSITRRDYPVIQGGILLIATMVIFVNLLVDILYGYVNPRIRLH